MHQSILPSITQGRVITITPSQDHSPKLRYNTQGMFQNIWRDIVAVHQYSHTRLMRPLICTHP